MKPSFTKKEEVLRKNTFLRAHRHPFLIIIAIRPVSTLAHGEGLRRRFRRGVTESSVTNLGALRASAGIGVRTEQTEMRAISNLAPVRHYNTWSAYINVFKLKLKATMKISR